LLDTVSTARGSGWVSPHAPWIISNLASWSVTHPLPRAVLTVSKPDSRAG